MYKNYKVKSHLPAESGVEGRNPFVLVLGLLELTRRDASSNVFDAVAGVGEVVEGFAFSAIVQTRTILYADEVPLAVVGRAEVAILLLAQSVLSGIWGTREAEICWKWNTSYNNYPF